ncbi:MAG: trigger factor [Rhodospirillaceae bacterium]
MQVTEKPAEGLKRSFNVVVPTSAIEEKVTTRLTEVGQQVRLPGFRPGKVPMNLLKKRFGEAVRGEILEKTVEESTQAAISEKALKPAVQPKIEVVKFEEGQDLEFSLQVEVLPEITADVGALELTRPTASVSDDEMNKALEGVQRSKATTEKVDRPAKSGDVVQADFVGRIDGEAFQGGTVQDAMIEIGSGRYIPGFEDQLVGAKAGDKTLVKVTFPAEYPSSPNLAGKAAEFDVTVKEVRELKLPELNDELAKSIGDTGLDSLKERLRTYLQQNHDAASRQRMKRQLLDKLAEGHSFAVPQGLVDIEFESIWRQMEQVTRGGQVDPEDVGKSEEDLKKEYRAIAERRVRLGLLLSEIGQKAGVGVSQEDIKQAITQEAMRYPGQEQQVVEYYQRNPQAIEAFRAPLFEEKVVDYLIGKANVTDKPVTVEELLREDDDV